MLSLCLTNYNRYDLLLESFSSIVNDERIDEIIISDDHSDELIRQKLIHQSFSEKVTLYFNERNLGMSMNKKLSVEKATNDWCIVFDSDNIMGSDYLDAMKKIGQPEVNTIYCPEFASPHFDYRKYSGMTIDKNNVSKYIDEPMFNCMLNTCNYVVNRDEYLKAYKYDHTIKGTDTIQFNYNWLKKGGKLFIVPGMQYFHRVHDESEFKKHMKYNMNMAEKFKNKISQLA